MKNNNLLSRIISGAIFLVLFICAVTINPYIYAAVFAFFCITALWEYFSICKHAGFNCDKIKGIIIGFLIFASTFFHSLGYIPTKIIATIPIILATTAINEIYRNKSTSLANWAIDNFAQIYITLPFCLTNYMLKHPQTGQFSGVIILCVFIFIWINDTGAYCSGRMFGKHKLFPRISPQKTVEGLIGGVLLSLIAAWPISLIATFYTLPTWIAISATSVFFANYGDLAESMIKRNAGVKDSGSIMPGHGGILDRFDSALLAIPAVWALIQFI